MRDSCNVMWGKKNIYWHCMKPGRINYERTMVNKREVGLCFRCQSRGHRRLRHSNPRKKPRERRHHLEYQLMTQAVEVLKTWTGKCTTPWKGSAGDDTHHIDGGSGSSFLNRRSLIYWVLYVLCVAAFGAKSNVTDIKTVTFRQPWGYEWEQQEEIIFCGNLWNKSNWLVRQCKKLDHNRDLEIIKPVQHIEVDWEVIIMRNSFYHLNIAKDIWGSL